MSCSNKAYSLLEKEWNYRGVPHNWRISDTNNNILLCCLAKPCLFNSASVSPSCFVGFMFTDFGSCSNSRFTILNLDDVHDCGVDTMGSTSLGQVWAQFPACISSWVTSRERHLSDVLCVSWTLPQTQDTFLQIRSSIYGPRHCAENPKISEQRCQCFSLNSFFNLHSPMWYCFK